MMYSENYLKWAKETKLPPLTNTQKRFAEFCLEHYKELSVIGCVESVFEDVRTWVKQSDNFSIPVVEEVKQDTQIPVIEAGDLWREWDWDDVEVEKKFDWSLPMKQIHEKYNPDFVPEKSKRKKTFKQPNIKINPLVVKASEKVELFDFEKDLYNKPDYDVFILYPKKSKVKRKCFCIGKLTSNQNLVYYDKDEDRYIVKQKDASFITYSTTSIQHLIEYNSVLPNGYKETLTEFIDKFQSKEKTIKEMLAAPTPNFHYED